MGGYTLVNDSDGKGNFESLENLDSCPERKVGNDIMI